MYKISFFLLIILLSFFIDVDVYATRADVNNDIQENLNDVELILKKSICADVSDFNWLNSYITGDVNCDGVVNTVDSQTLFKKVSGAGIGKSYLCTANSIGAFIGAQGGGANAIGGRGGIVYEVTNLDDNGIGSFRYGLENLTGSRIIVFKVGGYIHLNTTISIVDDSNITIAGQTAPGDGITLVFPSNPDSELFYIRNSHDIVIRYIKIRKGGAPASTYNQAGSNFSIIGDSHDIIVDHCSFSWAGDENFGAYNVHPNGQIAPYNITLQWSISSENLRRLVVDNSHMTDSTGFFFGSGTRPDTSMNVSVHHSFFSRNNNRNPLLKIGSGDIASNVIYNWGWYATGISGGISVDIIDNFYKAGLARVGGNKRPEISFKYAENGIPGTGVFADPSIYLEGNVGPHNSDHIQDAWNTMMHESDTNWGFLNGNGPLARVSLTHRRMQLHQLGFPIIRENANILPETILKLGGVGSSKRLKADGTCVNNRDLIDSRIINDFYNGEGSGLVSSVDMVGGWPYYNGSGYSYATEAQFLANPQSYQDNSGLPYLDSDHDGMSDIWEDAHGLDRNNANDRNLDFNNNGYTNLEEFLNCIE